ncbi:MAG: hypothetical protein AB1529_06535 [Candidatus Micrarchaeota archaeon]
MAGAHVRILFPSTVRPEEAGAASRGAHRLSRFGVMNDQLRVDSRSGRQVRHVRRGESILDIVTSVGMPVVHPCSLRGESLWSLIYERSIFGVGLTPNTLLEAAEDSEGGYKEPARMTGLSMSGVGAIVSLSMMRSLDAGLKALAIETAVAHELGHVFKERGTGHCPDAGCIMQENENFLDFLERFVKPRLDFCRSCSAEISTGVNMLERIRYS